MSRIEEQPGAGPQPDPPGPLYTTTTLERLAQMLGREGYCEVLDAIINDAPRALQSLQDAAATGDARKLHVHAHSLKSTCGMVGAQALLQGFEQLERGAACGELAADLPQQTAALERRYLRLVDQLRQLRAA